MAITAATLIVHSLLFHHFLLFGWAQSQQTSWRVEDIPNPMKNPELCGHLIGTERSMVCDVANLLDQETKSSIDRRASKMWDVEFAVVVIPLMVKSSWFSSVQSEAEYYGNTLLQNWGVGDSSLQNGVLIFLSVYDRVMFISLGNEIQSRLSSLEVDRVLKHIKPILQRDAYGSAIERAIIEINLIMTREITDHTIRQKERDNRLYMARVLGPCFLILLFTILVIWIFYSRKQETQIKQSRDDLRALLIELCLPDIKQDDDLEFFSASCPICFQLYRPTNLRSYDTILQQFLSDYQDIKENNETQDDPSAEDTTFLPEAYDTTLLKFIEESSKLRSLHTMSSTEEVIKINENKSENAQEQDFLLESQKFIRTRLESVNLDRDDFRNPVRFRCGHIFCLSCWRSLQQRQLLSDLCPLCESEQYLTLARENLISPSTSLSTSSFTTSKIPHSKLCDLVYRSRKIHKIHPTVMTKEFLSSLELTVTSQSREECVKLLLELCCETNRKVVDYEMRRRHIDDAWKEPGRPPNIPTKSD